MTGKIQPRHSERSFGANDFVFVLAKHENTFSSPSQPLKRTVIAKRFPQQKACPCLYDGHKMLLCDTYKAGWRMDCQTVSYTTVMIAKLGSGNSLPSSPPAPLQHLKFFVFWELKTQTQHFFVAAKSEGLEFCRNSMACGGVGAKAPATACPVSWNGDGGPRPLKLS